MSPLWGGRFTGQTDPLMARFNASLPFDWRLWDADITGSSAWARAIARAGLLTTSERDQIIAGLEALRVEIASDPAVAFAAASDEDIHSYVERRLTERIGAAAGKLCRRDRRGRRQAAHRPQPQRPGCHRRAAVAEMADRCAGCRPG